MFTPENSIGNGARVKFVCTSIRQKAKVWVWAQAECLLPFDSCLGVFPSQVSFEDVVNFGFPEFWVFYKSSFMAVMEYA